MVVVSSGVVCYLLTGASHVLSIFATCLGVASSRDSVSHVMVCVHICGSSPLGSFQRNSVSEVVSESDVVVHLGKTTALSCVACW